MNQLSGGELECHGDRARSGDLFRRSQAVASFLYLA